jgi:hypothetical protein
MRILELFAGTSSFGQVADEFEHEVISLDKDMPASIQCDILDWDYTVYPSNYFNFIWSSPPCVEYSIAKTRGIRNLELANALVLKTLEIINYFSPVFYVIENPQTGLLKHQPFMLNINYNDVDYCKYGFSYRKRTRLWNNLVNWEPRSLGKKDCGSMDGNRHAEPAQRGPTRTRDGLRVGRNKKQTELYRIPADLSLEILISLSITP